MHMGWRETEGETNMAIVIVLHFSFVRGVCVCVSVWGVEVSSTLESMVPMEIKYNITQI